MTDAYPRSPRPATSRVDHFPHGVYRRAFKANATTNSVTGVLPTPTEPALTTAGVHVLGKCNGISIVPYGTDGRSEEFRLWVSIWHPLYDYEPVVKSSETVVWIPTTVLGIDCTMHDGAPAVAGGPLVVGDLFCTQIDIAAGTEQPLMGTGKGAFNKYHSADMTVSAGDDSTTYGAPVSQQILTLGAKYVQFFIDCDGGAGTAAASGNCLFMEI